MSQQSHSWAYTQKKLSYKKTCTPMFIEALCTVTSTWGQPFSLLYLQFHTASWLLSISINMYENLIHYQRFTSIPSSLLRTETSGSQSQSLLSSAPSQTWRGCEEPVRCWAARTLCAQGRARLIVNGRCLIVTLMILCAQGLML